MSPEGTSITSNWIFLDLIEYTNTHTDTAGSFEGQQFRGKESSSRKQNQEWYESNHVLVKG